MTILLTMKQPIAPPVISSTSKIVPTPVAADFNVDITAKNIHDIEHYCTSDPVHTLTNEVIIFLIENVWKSPSEYKFPKLTDSNHTTFHMKWLTYSEEKSGSFANKGNKLSHARNTIDDQAHIQDARERNFKFRILM